MLIIPHKVTVVDVAARDGLQSFPRWVETDVKVALIDRLSDVGFPVIEVTGFVHPRKIPNLRDAEEVLARIKRRPSTIYRALVPNAKGAERAIRCSVPPNEILGLIVASETYLRKNQNMSTDEAVGQAIEAFRIAGRAGLSFVMAIAGSFWDLFEGRTPETKVLDLIDRFQQAGIRRFYLAGSLGMEDPAHVSGLIHDVKARWPSLDVGFHVHNMSGAATANVLAALDAGASFIEGSICGIGGGIALPNGTSATGNLASEDLVYLLNETGIKTGLKTDAVVAAARDIAKMLDITPVGHIAHCGSRSEMMSRANKLSNPD